MHRQVDVVVIGDGPAGSALAAALVRRGGDVVLVGADAPWRATYGTWADDVDAITWFDTNSIWAQRFESIAVDAGGRRCLERPYGVIDNAALRATLRNDVDHHRAHVSEIALAPAGSNERDRVVTSDDDVLEARLVVDATGWPGWAADGPGPSEPSPPRQTAFGVVFAEPPAGRLGEPMLMDFTSAPGCDDDGIGPSFAYALPVDDGWLVEETVLAAQPAVPPDALIARLAARLAMTNDELLASAIRTERVDIPMGGPLPDTASRLLAFGAAASLIHPATGYSLATSLELADPVAHAIVAELASERVDHSTVWDAIWPTSARRTRVLHDYGAQVVLGLDADDVRSFFGTFFDLDVDVWADYLRITTTPKRLARVMTAMFTAAPWRLRRLLVSQNPLRFARLLRPG
ncbi:lycopene cyclase family protein [Ilumatobacter coccineus]|uniref:Putative lycopene beta-cyclase n=1 Tax=Ilumatobacter coccineus (strain NBRC 103263 / KCTC 29153 / YM16-304) TaxID=1313172 RepID=A0A6C7E9J5_ILUCY|nr:lycopene cyclase family protein [Ilumatobacter coccineus]BAN02692.1 putative lycopene beta-cyclase [Ilumatobacter coccineus YM16-304]